MDSLKEQLSITYGDGWYAGFLAAKEIHDKGDMYDRLEEYQWDNLLTLSDYEAESVVDKIQGIDNLMVIPKQIDDATYIKICEESGVAIKQATLNVLLKIISECQ